MAIETNLDSPATGTTRSAPDVASTTAPDRLEGLSSQFGDAIRQATDQAVRYTRDQPVRALLAAAGVGALAAACWTATRQR